MPFKKEILVSEITIFKTGTITSKHSKQTQVQFFYRENVMN